MTPFVRPSAARLGFARQDGIGREARNCGHRPHTDLRLGRAPDRIQQSDGRFVEEVTHPDLGLGDHLDRAFFERTKCELGAASRETRADDDRRRHFRHDFSNEGQAVHARHFQVGDDYIGRFFLHLSPCNQRVRRSLHLDPAVGSQDGLHHLADHRRVIHDQDLQIICIHQWHFPYTPRTPALRGSPLNALRAVFFVSRFHVDGRLETSQLRGKTAQVFRVAHEQESVRQEMANQVRDHPVLRSCVEIDQNVPAKDGVKRTFHGVRSAGPDSTFGSRPFPGFRISLSSRRPGPRFRAT